MIKGLTHDAIDAVQNGKKQFVTTFVKHDGVADAMNTFIDTQAKYTKNASDAFIDIALSFGQLITDKNFGKQIVEAYGLDKMPNLCGITPSKKSK